MARCNDTPGVKQSGPAIAAFLALMPGTAENREDHLRHLRAYARLLEDEGQSAGAQALRWLVRHLPRGLDYPMMRLDEAGELLTLAFAFANWLRDRRRPADRAATWAMLGTRLCLLEATIRGELVVTDVPDTERLILAPPPPRPGPVWHVYMCGCLGLSGDGSLVEAMARHGEGLLQ